MENRNQHWIPVSYSKAWCDPDPAKQNPRRVYRYGKDGKYLGYRHPNQIFSDRPELYTIPMSDGGRDLSTEHTLQRLEDAYIRVRDRIVAKRDPLTDHARGDLILFIAALRARSPFTRDHHIANDTAVLRVADDMKASLARMPLDQRRRMSHPSLSSGEPGIRLEDFRMLAARPFGERLLHDIQIEAKVLAQMHLSILIAPPEAESFITSDAPVVWWDPMDPPPSRHPLGLGRPTIQVTLPISPRLYVLMTHVPRIDYIELGPGDVDQLNQRVLYKCREIFISQTPKPVITWDKPSA